MPLVTDYAAVKEIYAEAAERRIGLPVFCAEDRETLEAILAAGVRMAQETGVEDLPIIPGWTSRYPGRSQMKLLTACGDPILGTRLMFSDLKVLTDSGSPYGKLRVMPHLDHGFPWLDGDVMSSFADQFASIMCDASAKPFEENIRLTAEYVHAVKGRVVVEGAVDEILEHDGEGKNEPTTPEQALRFLRETGVDILVPNVGTEHRATADKVRYLSEQARQISAAVGRILCIHGTSSVKPQDIPKLPADGFVKINIYTTLAVYGGQALARSVLDNLGNVFDEEQLSRYIHDGVLGDRVREPGFGATRLPLKPKLDCLTNPTRRDAWFAAVRDRCCDFYRALNYRAFS